MDVNRTTVNEFATLRRDRGGHLCAIAVRDGAALRAFMLVERSKAGDIYVNVLPGHLQDSNIHSSYHRSGQVHHKSFGGVGGFVRRYPKPDANFEGVRSLLTMGIDLKDVRAVDTPCVESEVDTLFEIQSGDLRPDVPKTHEGVGMGATLSVTIAEPGQAAIINQGSKVVRELVLKDAVPWILLTLFDPRP
ncbi:MAG TPA: hypothetical protein VGP07_01605 [Polyangia bacterium]